MMKTRPTTRAWLIGLALATALTTSSRADFSFDVSLDTTALQANPLGAPYAIDFALSTGGNSNTDTATISLISLGAGGSAGGTINAGPGSSGDLTSGVTLTDSGFFADFNQTFMPGSTLTFHVTLTTAVNTPAPDNFSFSILDSSGGSIPTLDPSTADTLLSVDLTGTIPTVLTYQSDTSQVFPGGEPSFALPAPVIMGQSVPEPASFTMLSLGAAGMIVLYRRKRRGVA